MNFTIPIQTAKFLSNYTGNWAIAGGWAIDLFLEKITRPHQDIEIAIPRKEQLQLQQYLQNWELNYVDKGQFQPWKKDELLSLPIHEIHGHNFNGDALEVLLNDIKNDMWIFRRHPSITFPAAKLFHPSALHIPILHPVIVLLYKVKINKPKDKNDLINTLPHLKEADKKWLYNAIKSTHPKHEWLTIFKK